ncbi:MAG: peptidase, partial [Anaerolineae bacterium]|nr:peptidase [Anaerolineae bacterium]
MTYCVAIKLAEGLVFASDSRTNAGFDQIATFRKNFVFGHPGERFIALLTSGNLATSQSVISLLQSRGNEPHNDHLISRTSMYDAAVLVGATLREVVERDSAGHAAGTDLGCSLLIGGQIGTEPPRLFQIYPEGNFIEATRETPYLQIGESKYGKPILDRVIHYRCPMALAWQAALISFDSTMKSNLSVGMPLDMLAYRKDRLDKGHHVRIRED